MQNAGQRTGLARRLRPLLIALCAVGLLLPGVGTTTRAGPDEGRPGRAHSLDYETGVSVCRQTANLVLNASFEDALGAEHNWEMNKYCAYEAANSTSYEGAFSARILPSGFHSKECNLFTIIENLRVDGGQAYDYAARVKAHVTGGQALLRVSFWGSQGAALKEVGTAATDAIADTAGEWVELTGAVTAPAGAVYARVEAILTPGAADGSWVYLDDVYLGKSVCLHLEGDDTPDPVTAGGQLAYTLRYTNRGRGAANDVRITAHYDRHVDWVSAQPAPALGQDTWELGRLDAGRGGTIAVVVDVDDDLPPPSWILTTVDAGSAEMARPARETIATQVEGQPGACQVEISLDPPSQKTSLGVAARYTVQVANTGDREGEVTLTTTSSHASSLCLPERFTLGAGASRQAVLTVELSEYTPNQGMHQDVTSLTATLDCGASGRDQDTGTAATTILLPSYLPGLAKDHDARQCRTEAWETESTGGHDNDQAGTADGPLCPDRGYYGTPDDQWDWFRVWLGRDGSISVDLLDHIGSGVQLMLYYGSVDNMVARDCTLAPPYHVEVAAAPAGWYYIAIYTESGFDWYTPYTLFVHYR